MKSLKKVALWGLGAAIAMVAFSSSAKAATSAAIDIRVSINATKSLAIGTTSYNFGALAVNTSSVSATAITVDNDSGALYESYSLQGQNAASQGGGTTWNIAASTGNVDEYVLGAQFGTARPADTDAAFTNDLLDTSANNCTAGNYGNGTAAQSGSSVTPNTSGNANRRNLWFRIITPLFVTDVTERKAVVTVAVQ